jgi:hypothetical protein
MKVFCYTYRIHFQVVRRSFDNYDEHIGRFFHRGKRGEREKGNENERDTFVKKQRESGALHDSVE